MVLSMPAPHGPEDAAPQYQHLFQNVTTHRTPSWNVAPNPDKQWILQHTGKMEPIHIAFTDMLHQKRLQTLQSVDDAVEKLYRELWHLGELDNTYFLYTSDHGYHLGQYGIIKGKAFPYDFDIRVPFLMRGPKIPQGVNIQNIVLNIDIAPTLLDMAGVATPEHMDGKSIMELFDNSGRHGNVVGGVMKHKKAWRDSFLVERGKVTKKKIRIRERLEAEANELVLSKQERLEQECRKPEYQPPCRGKQQWACSSASGKLRIIKCRYDKSTENEVFVPGKCQCPPGQQPRWVSTQGRAGPLLDDADTLNKAEKRRQRQFLRDHVNQPNMLKPKFIREKRSERTVSDVVTPDDPSVGDVDAEISPGDHHPEPGEYFEQNDSEDDYDNDNHDSLDPQGSGQSVSGQRSSSGIPVEDDTVATPSLTQGPQSVTAETGDSWFVNTGEFPVPCRVLPDGSMQCNQPDSVTVWRSQQERLQDMIADMQRKLAILQDAREELEALRPGGLSTDRSSTQVESEVTTQPSPSHTVQPAGSPDAFPVLETPTDSEDGYTPQEPGQVDKLFEEFAEDQNNREESVCVCDFMADQPMSQDRPRSSRRQEVMQEREERRMAKLREREEKRKERQREKANRKQDRQKEREDEGEGTSDIFFPGNSLGRSPQVNDPTRDCNSGKMKCFTHDNDHWKTAPLWEYGPFCFCPNSNNNTYWCMRTVNSTHNFLYCEFITGFISFYDMMKDPYQLRNAVHDLSYPILHQLHSMLDKLKTCSGSRMCNVRHRPKPDGTEWEEDGSGEFSGDGDSSGEEPLIFTTDTDTSGDYEHEREEFLWLTNIFRLDTPHDAFGT